MFRAGHNSSSIANSLLGLAGSRLPRLVRVPLFLVLAAWLFSVLGFGAAGELTAVRSYEGNFLVEAPDTGTAAAAAKLAELTRGAVFELLGHESEWPAAATVRLRVRRHNTPDGELPLWTISVAGRGFKVTNEDIYPNKRNDVMVLQLVALCLEDIARGLPREKQKAGAVAVPLWLRCGVAENLSRENVARLRQFASQIASEGNFLPLEELFTVNGLPSDEAQRELFFKESGSVVDFLLHEKRGRFKLRRAIMQFRAQGDFAAAILSSFSNDFAALAQLQESWKEFAVKRAERTIGGQKMALSETKEALDRVLTVSIPAIDRDTLEEKVITTDLRGLLRHRNARTVRRIASEKASAVFQLSLRARPEYAPVLQEYLQAISAIAKNDRAEFKRHFAHAERLRKELEKAPYFEAEKAEHVNTADQ